MAVSPGSTRAPARVAARRSHTVGYGALLLLACALPFESETRPLFWTTSLQITNLTILVAAVAGLALISLGSLAAEALRGSESARAYLSWRRLPLVLIAAFLLSSLVSTALATHSMQSVTWLSQFVCGALLWMALPLWLADDTSGKVSLLGKAIVIGAAAAAVVGIVEVAAGAAFDGQLQMFKLGPDMMGPFLRLSATFTSANVAAIYLELSLPFALVALLSALGKPSRGWLGFLVWLAASELLLAALLLTYSRGSVLGLSAELLAIGIAGRRMWRGIMAGRSREVTVALASVVAIFGALVVSVAPVAALRFSMQSDRSWYQAAYRSHVPATMSAGRTETLRVIVENRSPLTWAVTAPHSYGLSYHWLRPSTAVVRFANPITWLRSDLPPGGDRVVRVRVTPPPAGGRYLLAWDLIWNGTTWFAPKTGRYDTVPVRVIGRSGVSDSIRPDIPRLPDSGTLGRAELWSLALSMVRHRPLFGMGPEGVRANYTSFATPSMPRKPPPHAHNLELEMLADWGVVGAGLFLTLVAVLWWPLLRRLWTGQPESVWQLALIGAAAALLAHGLVDYFFNKQAIVMLFWLMSGLAALMSPTRATESRTLAADEKQGTLSGPN